VNETYSPHQPLTALTETEEVILRRRSIRTYKDKQVPEELIHRVLQAGRFAPSAGNYQPWKFIVVRDPEIISDLTATVRQNCTKLMRMLDYRRPGQGWRRPLANLFIRLMRNALHPTPFGAISLVADERLDLFHGAPTVIFIFKDTRGVSNPDLDCGIAGQNMVLAAHSMGLGTCWIGFSKLAFQRGTRWKKFFNIRFPYEFASSLAVGWPLGDPDGKVERPVPVVDWYEKGAKRTLDGPAAAETVKMTERLHLQRLDRPAELCPGVVRTDPEKCNGCSLCTRACPSKALHLENGVCTMLSANECVYCADCQAICPEGAIYLVSPHAFTGYYKTINKGTSLPPTGP